MGQEIAEKWAKQNDKQGTVFSIHRSEPMFELA